MQFDFLSLSDQLERVYSRRLAMRAVSLSDAWPLFHATRNPSFNKHLLWDQPSNEEQVLQRIDAIVDASRRGRMAALSAVIKQTGEWVSLFRFQPYVDDPGVIEMGVWTHDRFWHGRYSLELGRLCVDAAFSVSDIPLLLGATVPANRGSCQLMQAVGMKPRNFLVNRATESGVIVQAQEFVIERTEWLAQREQHGRFWTFPMAGEERDEEEAELGALPLQPSYA